MYAVVGCNGCGALWLLEDPGETAECPRCGKRHRTGRLKRLYRAEDREAARQARAAMLAERRGAGEDFADLDSVAEMERRLDDGATAVDDREYLEAAGVDADAVAAAGADDGGRRRDRPTVVRDGIRETDPSTEEAVVAYATDHGVPAEAARDLLDGLRRRGEVIESDGRLRLL
jgi:hypothetical protein